MIITKLKSQEEILRMVNSHKKIFVVGCGSCAKQCRTGGEEDVNKLIDWIREKGKEVTGSIIPGETCHIPLVKREFRKYNNEINYADAVLVMACGAGTSAVKESVSKRVYPANDTVSLGNTLRNGDFIGRCSLCGECVIGETGGLCPVTICPKGVLNGPCGGMDKGKCEVNKEENCVWLRIYETLSLHDDVASMQRIKSPKDYSKNKRNARVGERYVNQLKR